MTKAVFGEYAAYTTPGGARFQNRNKLVSEKSIPPEVVAYLKKQLGEEPKAPEPKFPMPTEEQKAKMRAESLQVPPELQVEEPAGVDITDQLDASDFEDEVTDEQIETIASQIPSETLEPLGSPEPSPAETPLPSDPDIATAGVDPDFLESVSIHTAPLQDIAEALYNRFGIYTVYLRKLPVPDEINPLTGENFTKYHQGIAYQAAIRAENQGILDRNPEQGRAMLNQIADVSANMPIDTPAQTMGEARRENSFAFRTNVAATQEVATTEIKHMLGADGLMHAIQVPIPQGQTGEANGAKGRYDAEEDEIIAEPQMGRQVIRPNW